MTDLHTHILPGMDDGAKTVEESLAMLRMERSQGVDTVVLTPHFYRNLENPRRFLQRRKEAVALLDQRIWELSEEDRQELPRMVLGAEVAWWPAMAEWEELPELCIGATKNLLLELPFTPWNDHMIHQLYEFYGRTGITPVIAHLERYLKLQRAEHIRAVLELGVSVQISADMLLRTISKRKMLKLLMQGQAQLVASDCHDPEKRPPNLGAAMEIISDKLGDEQAKAILRKADELVLE